MCKVERMHNLSNVSDGKIMTQNAVKGKYAILWKYKNFLTIFSPYTLKKYLPNVLTWVK